MQVYLTLNGFIVNSQHFVPQLHYNDEKTTATDNLQILVNNGIFKQIGSKRKRNKIRSQIIDRDYH